MPQLRFLALLLLLLGPIGSPPSAADTAPLSAAANSTIFDEVWQRTEQRFYDANFNSHDWRAIGDQYRPLILAAASEAERAALLNRMLGELGASHTGYYTQADQEYFELADIFSGALRHELPRIFPNREVVYDGIGALYRHIDGKIFVIALLAGFPAEQAGLLPGDEIVAADGAPFAPIAAFAGRSGQSVALTIRRKAEGETSDIRVTPERIRPNEAFAKAIADSARIIDFADRKIGYIRIYSYARWSSQNAIENAISSGPLKDADALIWDLRDGWGGAQPDYLDIFNGRSPTMTVTGRGGAAETVNARWRKPVVLLINEGSRSGKEVLAFGFKKYGFGPVVGTRTKGDVLAATAFLLSDNGLLELPVQDVRVDGERLEGVGVAPTIEVPFHPEYAAGDDPQLRRAVEVAAEAAHG
jgi:carboxyl-terminal processing protease